MRPLLLLLCLLWPTVTLAEDYAVVGDDLAGKVTVDREACTWSLTGVRFEGKKHIPFAQSGTLGDDVGGLTLLHTEERWQVNGVADWLRLDFRQRVTETHTARFEADGERLTGTLDDMQLTLVPQPALDDLSVLVVPGLSTNLWNQYGVPYLDENMATLEARGLRARRLTINTEQSIAVNAAEIAREIRVEVDAGRRVLLIAHSKGGADTITALADPRSADLLPHVAGLIAIQPVYGGSRIADFVAAGTPFEHILHEACGSRFNNAVRSSLQWTVDQAFSKLLPFVNKVDSDGSPDAVRDLRSEVRQAMLAEHPYPADRIPTVVVRGYIEGRSLLKARHVLRGPLVVFQMYTAAETGERSDGMVTLGMQSIPGAVDEVTLADLDHFEPGFRGESPHTPAKITHDGLARIIGHLKAQPQGRGRQVLDMRLGE